MDNQDGDGAAGRSKRTKHDKHGRFAALQRLKSLKGKKNKYEMVEEAPVYEEVSEKEFSRIVQQRQEDEWIVDDNGFGYADDGREIFDEEVGNDIYTEKANKKTSKKSFEGPQKKRKPSDIKSMFKAFPTKRKIEQDVKLEDDDILRSIMEDLHKETDLNSFVPKPMVLRKKHKFKHHSPVQRPSPSPYESSRQQTPLASSYVPKAADVPRPNAVHRKRLQPKVVNFDNHVGEEIIKSPFIEDASQDLKPKEKPAEVHIDETDSVGMDFDPSGDIFEEEIPALEETPSPEVAQKNIPVITTTFQGSLSNEINR